MSCVCVISTSPQRTYFCRLTFICVLLSVPSFIHLFICLCCCCFFFSQLNSSLKQFNMFLWVLLSSVETIKHQTRCWSSELQLQPVVDSPAAVTLSTHRCHCLWFWRVAIICFFNQSNLSPRSGFQCSPPSLLTQIDFFFVPFVTRHACVPA